MVNRTVRYCAVVHCFSTLQGCRAGTVLPVRILPLFGGAKILCPFLVNH